MLGQGRKRRGRGKQTILEKGKEEGQKKAKEERNANSSS